ncbi:hypothetical protein Tco_1556324 [Tanacetum coccineum]
MIRSRAASPLPLPAPSPPLLLPSTTHKDDLTEVDMPLQKRACFTAPTGRFEVRESSSAAAARKRIRDEERLTSHIQYEHDKFRELVRTAEAGPQDGSADAGSSC